MTKNDFNDASEISKIIADSIEKVIEEHVKDFRKKSVLKMEKVMVQSFDDDLLKICEDKNLIVESEGLIITLIFQTILLKMKPMNI